MNARLDEPQAGIKIAGRNFNNLRYADDNHSNGRKQRGTNEPLDESEKAILKLKIKKTKIMAPTPITLVQIEGGKVEVLTDFLFLGSKITAGADCSHEIKRHLPLKEKL